MTVRLPLRPALVALALVSAGQLVLLVLGPLTRAGRAFGGTAGPGGIALLSSDSLYYLELSQSVPLLAESPLTRVLMPLLLRLGAAVGSAEGFAVTVNLIALTLATMALYDLGRRLARSDSAGVLAGAALAVNPLTNQWVRFVLTESLTYSAIIGIVWAVLRHIERKSLGSLMLVIGLGALLALLRPNGALILAGALSAIIGLRGRPSFLYRRILLHGLVWGTALFVFFVGSREPDLGSERTTQLIVGLLYDGVIVEGTPDVLVTTSMPTRADASDVSLSGAIRYALRHPVDVARLGVLRIGYETLQLRPHYPGVVNLAMGVGFAAFLLFAVFGARAVPSQPLRTTVLMVSTPQILLVAATFAVPESRYGWSYLVTLCVWAGIGADRVLRRTGLLRRRTHAA